MTATKKVPIAFFPLSLLRIQSVLVPSAGHRNKFHKKVTDYDKLTVKRHVIHHTTL